jgi:hypothetical protein
VSSSFMGSFRCCQAWSVDDIRTIAGLTTVAFPGASVD